MFNPNTGRDDDDDSDDRVWENRKPPRLKPDPVTLPKDYDKTVSFFANALDLPGDRLRDAFQGREKDLHSFRKKLTVAYIFAWALVAGLGVEVTCNLALPPPRKSESTALKERFYHQAEPAKAKALHVTLNLLALALGSILAMGGEKLYRQDIVDRVGNIADPRRRPGPAPR